MKRALVFTAILLLTLAATGGVMWQSSYKAGLQDLRIKAEQELQQAVDQFQSKLSNARALPTLLARNRVIVDSLRAGVAGPNVRAHLTRAHDLSGAYEIRLLNRNRTELLSSVRDQNKILRRSDPDYFRTAMSGALGVAISFEVESRVRTLTFARSVIERPGQQIGVVAVDVDLEPLETSYRARPYTFALLDKRGTVVFSNRASLLYRDFVADGETGVGPYPVDLVSPEEVDRQNLAGVELWSGVPGQSTRDPVVVSRQPLLPLGVQAILLLDSSAARAQANKLAALAVMTVALMLVSAFALYQHRRQLISRIEANRKLNTKLDQRVAARSAELEQAQSQLVQAAKLSALGTMSAGISHELNQPIAAIQNFAFMATRFIADKDSDAAVSNLREIESQTERMSRIIRNLRDFARKDDMPTAIVELGEVIDPAVKICADRLRDEAVSLVATEIDPGLMVLGGKIRLQQVMFNLIDNAIDAVSGQDEKRITISAVQTGKSVSVSVADTGPGLSEPERVFEPFYSTKSGTKEDGLGLGLSISFGFVESFGGSLRATNLPDGGALFTLRLPSATTSGDNDQC